MSNVYAVDTAKYQHSTLTLENSNRVISIEPIDRSQIVTYPRQCNWSAIKSNYGEKVTYTGFLAQEVEQAALSSGYDFSGYTKPQNDHNSTPFVMQNLWFLLESPPGTTACYCSTTKAK